MYTFHTVVVEFPIIMYTSLLWLYLKVYKRPVVVTNYPKEFKAFYMRLDEVSE